MACNPTTSRKPHVQAGTCRCWNAEGSPRCLRGRGLGIREIAGLLGRVPSTVSRELRRNSRPHDYGRYDPDLAHHRGRERAGRPRRSKLSTDPDLKAEVQDKLNLEWSPEQIAAHLRSRRPDRPERHLRHETVYRALYQGAKGGLSRTLTRKLRTGRPLRKQRRRSDQRMPTPGPSSTTPVQRSRLQVALLSRHPSTRTGSSAISGRKVASPALPTYRTTTRSGSRTGAISSTPGRGSCGSGAAELRGHRRPRHPAPTRELLPLHSRRPGTAARRVRRD
ncbi:transposase [Streptomyces sp. NBC_00467]|uniref:transposase n=1 Tax=Streptomyces sp. NBC_00467 TaxID=2975752 RepID=UPI003FA73191